LNRLTEALERAMRETEDPSGAMSELEELWQAVEERERESKEVVEAQL